MKGLLTALCGWAVLAAPVVAAPTDTPGDGAAALMRAIGPNQAALRLFLQAMPKGGDLHNHLDGAIYAEDLLAWAASKRLCVATDPMRVVPAPCRPGASVPAATVVADYPLYSRAIDALSTRGFELGKGDPLVSGADRFFATFEDFEEAFKGNAGKGLAIAREQAAGDHLAYLELQIGASPLAAALPKDWATGASPDDLPGLFARLAPFLPGATSAARKSIDAFEADANAAQHCGATDAAPGCEVAQRYLMSAMRIYAPAQVFAELAYGFALVRADPRVVGVNIVAPEHDPVAIRDYRRHMAMFAFLKHRFPEVPLSLHAGEITLGMVPPRDLKFHIHDAVAVAGARRIGHGVDIAYEDDALALLGRMARERIAVEINLTSNAVILGVVGKAHPLALYRAAGVPVVLSTDDEGVSRTDMTNEYLRAATEQGLDYRALKRIARDSLTFSFVAGSSLWTGEAGGARVGPCAGSLDDATCGAFARTSEKAALQIRLERQFDTFERGFVPAMKSRIAREP